MSPIVLEIGDERWLSGLPEEGTLRFSAHLLCMAKKQQLKALQPYVLVLELVIIIILKPCDNLIASSLWNVLTGSGSNSTTSGYGYTYVNTGA